MRKTLTVTIDKEGRDKGKVFELTEMSAVDSERWAIRCLFALMNAGVEIDEEADLGMESLVALGLNALSKIKYEDAEPLLDTMLGCVKVIPDPNNPSVVRGLFDSDIEEVSTRLRLRKEVWGLHTGFFSQESA